MESFLDSLNDDQLLSFLKRNYGHDEPIWEECTKEEYEQGQTEVHKHLDNMFNNPELKLPSFEEITDWFTSKRFKKEPIYKEWKGGILDLIKLQDTKKPDYYKYYRLVGYKKLILVGGKIADYLKKRGIKL